MIQKQPPQVLYKKGVFKNFAKFIGNHLCCASFNFAKLLRNFFTEPLWEIASYESDSDFDPDNFGEDIWDRVFKNEPSKICERQPLENLKGYGLHKAYHTPSNFLKAVFHKFCLVHCS